MEQHDLHQELRAAAQARFDALEPFARESQRALDEAYYLVVLREAEATLSSPNLTDKLKSAVSSACEAACLLVGLDHSNFILCGGRDKTEPLLDAIRKQLDSDLQPSPEALARCAALLPNGSNPPALEGRTSLLKLWKALALFVAFAGQCAVTMQDFNAVRSGAS